jgi:hypothetical protein
MNLGTNGATTAATSLIRDFQPSQFYLAKVMRTLDLRVLTLDFPHRTKLRSLQRRWRCDLDVWILLSSQQAKRDIVNFTTVEDFGRVFRNCAQMNSENRCFDLQFCIVITIYLQHEGVVLQEKTHQPIISSIFLRTNTQK